MPRPIQYNRNQVLEAATNLFWKQGYDKVSMNDLVRETGLNRYSMYEVFGNKAGLFAAVLEHYCDSAPPEVADLFKAPFSLKKLADFLYFVAEYASAEDCMGCMVTNTIIENAQEGDPVIEIVKNHLKKKRELFSLHVKAGQESGEVNPERDCDDLADYVICFIQGLMVLSKTTNDPQVTKKLVDMVLLTLKS